MDAASELSRRQTKLCGRKIYLIKRSSTRFALQQCTRSVGIERRLQTLRRPRLQSGLRSANVMKAGPLKAGAVAVSIVSNNSKVLFFVDRPALLDLDRYVGFHFVVAGS
jgi:hypothetical protein